MLKRIFFCLSISVLSSCVDPKPELITIFSHGLLCNKIIGPFVYSQKHLNGFVRGPYTAFNYDDAFNPFISNLGQEDDVRVLHDHCKEYDNVILLGCSRGASAAINYLGTHQPTNIRAAIIESPFDHVKTIQEHVKKTYPGVLALLANQVGDSVFTRYKQNSLHPIETALGISKDLPILFVASKQDIIVPDYSTLALYKLLRAHGYTKVHLFYAEKGSHGLIIRGPEGTMYRNVVHAFYKHYCLPYDPKWQEQGQQRFEQCQPDL